MPAVATYFVFPAWSAATHASLMCWGVSKSGSPAAKLQTSTPAAAMDFALASTARVGDAAMPRAHVDRGGVGEDGIGCKGLHQKRAGAPNARGDLINCPVYLPVPELPQRDLEFLAGRLSRANRSNSPTLEFFFFA